MSCINVCYCKWRTKIYYLVNTGWFGFKSGTSSYSVLIIVWVLQVTSSRCSCAEIKGHQQRAVLAATQKLPSSQKSCLCSHTRGPLRSGEYWVGGLWKSHRSRPPPPSAAFTHGIVNKISSWVYLSRPADQNSLCCSCSLLHFMHTLMRLM